jgi:hypothetical protein
VTGESVELCPGELVESHATVDELVTNVDALTQQGWGGREWHELGDVHTQLYYEAVAVTRVLERRERGHAAAARGDGRPPGRQARRGPQTQGGTVE